MSLDPQLADYFLKSPSSTVIIETYEFSHPSFTKTHRIVKNDARGITATLEDGAQAFFEYAPLQTTRIATTETLDSEIDINLGDQGDIMAAEIDAVRAAAQMRVKPTCVYRGYRSDDYTQIMEGPFTLTITDTVRREEGAAFKASPRALNDNRTGARQLISRFPMLIGFVRGG